MSLLCLLPSSGAGYPERCHPTQDHWTLKDSVKDPHLYPVEKARSYSPDYRVPVPLVRDLKRNEHYSVRGSKGVERDPEHDWGQRPRTTTDVRGLRYVTRTSPELVLQSLPHVVRPTFYSATHHPTRTPYHELSRSRGSLLSYTDYHGVPLTPEDGPTSKQVPSLYPSIRPSITAPRGSGLRVRHGRVPGRMGVRVETRSCTSVWTSLARALRHCSETTNCPWVPVGCSDRTGGRGPPTPDLSSPPTRTYHRSKTTAGPRMASNRRR